MANVELDNKIVLCGKDLERCLFSFFNLQSSFLCLIHELLFANLHLDVGML